jgi:hypothetical protein
MASTPEWTHSLPTALFDELLPKLAVVLELTQKAEGTATPVAKQALLHAVCPTVRSSSMLTSDF